MAREVAEGTELRRIVDLATALDSYAVARLVSIFQDRRPTAAARRAEVLRLLADHGTRTSHGTIIGFTGTPGSGKSSLLGRLAGDLLRADPDRSVAILAIDPSSRISGGALLGDRTRLQAADLDHRLFFRSEASDTELGGLSPSSFQVCRLLSLLYDCVVVETVGIGQSEADVRYLAQHVFLVIAPLGGDEVQYLKAGIIEIPDAFIVNKSDEPASDVSFRQLKASLWMARPFDADELPVHRTSAKTGAGLVELAGALTQLIEAGGASDDDVRRREAHFFERWVQDEWGRTGLRHLTLELGGAQAFIADAGGFDPAQLAFSPLVAQALRA